MTKPPWEDDDEDKGPGPDYYYDQARDQALIDQIIDRELVNRVSNYTVRTFYPNARPVVRQMQGPWFYIDKYITKAEAQGAQVHVSRDGHQVYRSSGS